MSDLNEDAVDPLYMPKFGEKQQPRTFRNTNFAETSQSPDAQTNINSVDRLKGESSEFKSLDVLNKYRNLKSQIISQNGPIGQISSPALVRDILGNHNRRYDNEQLYHSPRLSNRILHSQEIDLERRDN